MHEELDSLYELQEKVGRALMERNEQLNQRDNIPDSELEPLDYLAHTLKSLDTSIAMREHGGYSGNSYEGGMDSMRGGNSNARGRRRAPRDSMGRYSGEGGYSYADGREDAMTERREMLQKLPSEERRRAMRMLDDMR